MEPIFLDKAIVSYRNVTLTARLAKSGTGSLASAETERMNISAKFQIRV